MMAMWPATKMSYQLTFKMYVKITVYKNNIFGSYVTDFNRTFTKMIQLELATKASHQLTLKM